MKELKVFTIDINKTKDDFKCITCSDAEFITESIRQNMPPIEIKKFERIYNVGVLNNEDFIIRFI